MIKKYPNKWLIVLLEGFGILYKASKWPVLYDKCIGNQWLSVSYKRCNACRAQGSQITRHFVVWDQTLCNKFAQSNLIIMIEMCCSNALCTKNYVRIILSKQKHAWSSSPSRALLCKQTCTITPALTCVTAPSIAIPVSFVPH